MKFEKHKKKLFWVLAYIILFAVFEGVSFLLVLIFDLQRYDESLFKPPYNTFHPYLGWEARPSRMKGVTIMTDENAHSITPLTFENPDINIVITGGSTMFGVGSSSNEMTVPSSLERIIYERMNIKAEVVNLSVRGYQSFQEMLSLHRFLKSNKADIVLSVSGTNDAQHAFYYSSDIRSASLPLEVYKSVALIHKAEQGETIIRVHPGRSKLRLLNSFNLLYHIAKKASSLYSNIAGVKEPSPRNVITSFPDNISERVKITITNYAMMNQNAREYGARFVMFLQPTLFTKSNPKEKEVRLGKRMEKNYYIRKEYGNLYYKAFRSSINNFTYYDLSKVFDRDNETETYVDICHYNDFGCYKLAEAIYTHIKPLIEMKINGRQEEKQSL